MGNLKEQGYHIGHVEDDDVSSYLKIMTVTRPGGIIGTSSTPNHVQVLRSRSVHHTDAFPTLTSSAALTVFSPDGHLFQVRLAFSGRAQPPKFQQVEYALEAVRKGTCAVRDNDKRVHNSNSNFDVSVRLAFEERTSSSWVSKRNPCCSYKIPVQ